MQFVNACKKILEISKFEESLDREKCLVWYYIQIINHTKLLIYNDSVRKKCNDVYREYKLFLKKNKQYVWNLLSFKNKIYYYMLIYFPYILSFIKKVFNGGKNENK